MLEEITKVDTLMEWLVDLANIHGASERKQVHIAAEIQHMLKTYEKQIEAKKIQVAIHWGHDSTVSANKGYFQILLSNLIANAIKYNKKGGKLIFTIEKNTLTIEDSGVWIESVHHTKVWERFYKVIDVHNTQGSGIGLSLVKKIADTYGWTIKIESKKGEFTRFTIRF